MTPAPPAPKKAPTVPSLGCHAVAPVFQFNEVVSQV